jgi:hypothetical protein
MVSCKAMLCCESTIDERSAGNRHATFCGSRGRFIAPGDPVGLETGAYQLGLVFKALDALDLRASLGDEKPPSSNKDGRVPEPSGLDEVFRQLQRPKRQ